MTGAKFGPIIANWVGATPDAIAPAKRSENAIDGRNERVGGADDLNAKRSSKEGIAAVVAGVSA